MSTFLDKNKKTSALASLLLLIRRRKAVTALLLLVALTSFLFVSPSNVLLRFPGGARVAGLAGGKRDYGGLLAAFRAAKEGGAKAGWSAFMRGGEAGGAGRLSAGSTGSLDFVKGKAKDLEASGGSGVNLVNPGSIAGVLHPDDAKNRAGGEVVALLENDMSGERAGRVQSAFTGGFASGSGEGALSGGAFASEGFFSNDGGGGGALSGNSSDTVRGVLEGIKLPTGKSVRVPGGAKGQLSASKTSALNVRNAQGLVRGNTPSGQRYVALVQLATGRGQAAIAVNCLDSGCPGEFAATTTGLAYDGNTIRRNRSDILMAPEIEGGSSSHLPDSSIADTYIHSAEKMEDDAIACRNLHATNGPKYLKYDKARQKLSEDYFDSGCHDGSLLGTVMAFIKGCRRKKEVMNNLCKELMTLRCGHIRACKLTQHNKCELSDCEIATDKLSLPFDYEDDLIYDGIKTQKTTIRTRSD